MKKTAPKSAKADPQAAKTLPFIEWLESMPNSERVIDQKVDLSLYTGDWLTLAQVAKAENCSLTEAVEVVLGLALSDVANGDGIGGQVLL